MRLVVMLALIVASTYVNSLSALHVGGIESPIILPDKRTKGGLYKKSFKQNQPNLPQQPAIITSYSLYSPDPPDKQKSDIRKKTSYSGYRHLPK
tara:strand:- start:872 stop:1153 length:282 start_codon:yes stop_codon:yes gene_type:complete